MKNYYKILEISQDASIEVIHAAYKAMSKKNHPDLCEGDKAQASVKMQEINEAYEILSDVNLRQEYDKELNLYIKQRRVKVVGASNNENTSNPANTNSNTNVDVGATSHTNTPYNAQNLNPNSTPTATPNSQNQEHVDKKKLATGCGCWIVIIIIAVGVFLFINRKTFLGDNNVTDSYSPAVNTAISSDDPDTKDIIHTISTYLDAAKLNYSSGDISKSEFNDIQSKYTTENYADSSLENFEIKKDWANDIVSILDIQYTGMYSGTAKAQAFVDFCTYTLPELLNDCAKDTNYDITEINIDGDKAVAAVKIQAVDFSSIIVATANEVKKDAERSDNLGITPDYSSLFKKHIKKVKPDYLNTISENFEFTLVKDGDNWKIDKINNRNLFLQTFALNMATFK